MSDRPIDPPEPGVGPPALHAPWRLNYLEDLSAKEKPAPGPGGTREPPKPALANFLRAYWLDPAGDRANHIIERTDAGLILLNKYPYANGHLLVCLGEPRGRLLDYSPTQREALWRLVDRAAAILDHALDPQGINIGLNQGRAAGAGLPEHLHVHLVPRWGGDVNFMTTVGLIRVIPSSLDSMAERLRQAANTI